MPVECVCQNPLCGKTFFEIPSRLANQRGVYCSQACKHMAQSQKVAFTCLNPECGRLFLLSPADVDRGRGFYCCRACQYPPMLQTCYNPACGKTFKVSPSTLKKGGGKYCSWACRPHTVHSTDRHALVTLLWQSLKPCYHGPNCPFCCWEYGGQRDQAGYGRLRTKKGHKERIIRTHRLIWEVVNDRPVPEGLWILHHCDNPPCNNPWHLYPGTAKDNTKDAVDRDRFPHTPGHPILRGEELPQAKLTTRLVLSIRQRVAAGERQSDIAAELCLSRATICLAVHGKRWAHITNP